MTDLPPPTIKFNDGTVLPAADGFKPIIVERGTDGVTRALNQCTELSARLRNGTATGIEDRREIPATGAGTSPQAFASLEAMSQHLRSMRP